MGEGKRERSGERGLAMRWIQEERNGSRGRERGVSALRVTNSPAAPIDFSACLKRLTATTARRALLHCNF